MIVRQRPSLVDLFTVYRLSVLARIAPQIVLVTLVSVAVTIWAPRQEVLFHSLGTMPMALLGIAVSISLSFRTSVCYDRWWEARRQLGSLVAETRSLGRLLLSLRGGDRARREAVTLLLVGYARALMEHLRRQRPVIGNTPDRLMRELGSAIAAMLAEGEFGELIFGRLDGHLAAMTGIQASCERLRSTPTPFSYSLLLHRMVYAFCLLLPFGLAGSLGYSTPVLCGVMAYAFFGLDALGDELEQPFGRTMNALPLDALAQSIEISLLEALERPEIPGPLLPVDYVLL